MSILASPIPLYQLPTVISYTPCNKCGGYKPRSEYYRNRKICNNCIKIQQHAYNEKHKEELAIKRHFKNIMTKDSKNGKLCFSCKEEKTYAEFACSDKGNRHSRYCNECAEKIDVINKNKHNEKARISRKLFRSIPDDNIDDTGMKIISFLSDKKTSFISEISSQLEISEYKALRQIKYMRTEGIIQLKFGGLYKLIELTEEGLKMVQA